MQPIDVFKNSNGYFEGHTSFKNGFHGNGWIEKGFVIKNPTLFQKILRLQANQIKKYFPEANLLVGPAVNGAIIASHLSNLLNIEFAVTNGKDQEIEFHRMNMPANASKTILIEDLVFTGNDIRDNIKFLNEYGLKVLGISTWINRSEELLRDFKLISVINTAPFKKWLPNECPLCKNNILVKYEGIRE